MKKDLRDGVRTLAEITYAVLSVLCVILIARFFVNTFYAIPIRKYEIAIFIFCLFAMTFYLILSTRIENAQRKREAKEKAKWKEMNNYKINKNAYLAERYMAKYNAYSADDLGMKTKKKRR